MKKRIVSLTLALALVFSLSVSASAAPVVPLWDQAEDCILSLGFSGSTADCYVSITCRPGTSLMRVTTYLQKQNSNGSYSNVKTWYEEVHGTEFRLDDGVSGCASGQYRLAVNAVVYDTKGNSEAVTGETFSRR